LGRYEPLLLELWAPERLGHLSLGMRSRQAAVLDQVGAAAHQAFQLAR
jgi:hypothetical protein